MVDWIDIHISLTRSSQFWWINKEVEKQAGRKGYIEALDAGPGGAATEFRIRCQEPDFKVVQTMLSGIEANYGFATPCLVTGIEISVDFYPREPSEEARARMHGVLIRHFFPTTRVLRTNRMWPRIMPGSTKTTDYTISRNEKDASLDIGARMTPGMDRRPLYSSTYYVSERDDSRAFWRIQNKVVDKQNIATGTYVDLPEAEKRARIEVTLGTQGCREVGLHALHDLKAFKFTRLQKGFFQFMKPTFAIIRPGSAGSALTAVGRKVEDMKRERFLNAGVLGLQIREDAGQELRKGYLPDIRRWHRTMGSKMPPAARTGAGDYGMMVAYEELSRIVARALSDLQEKVRGEMGM